MGREINTIGSKANDASIQKLVVMMKDELEKIKEQTSIYSETLKTIRENGRKNCYNIRTFRSW